MDFTDNIGEICEICGFILTLIVDRLFPKSPVRGLYRFPAESQGHIVIPPFKKPSVAPEEPRKSEQKPLYNPETQHRFPEIFRACRFIHAGHRKNRRYKNLINSERKSGRFSYNGFKSLRHLKILLKSESLESSSGGFFDSTITISQGIENSFLIFLKTSRTALFS